MRASFNLFVSAAVLGLVTALPADGNVFARGGKIVARGITLDSSCDRTNPFKSSEKYSVKVNAALADFKTMVKDVTSGQTIKTDVTYRRSDAFTHYFADEQYDQVMKLMNFVANPDNYNFNILCGSDSDKATCADGPIAGSNPTAGSPNMVLCDKFFDPKEDETKNELSVRDGSSGRRGWCQKTPTGSAGNKFPFFSVSGLTIFHEITHLDYVGVAAGLTERTFRGQTGHGTLDVYEVGSDSDTAHYKRPKAKFAPYDSARQLKSLWESYDPDHSQYMPLVQTFENAESYAASALEWHFELLCKFSIESDWQGF